MFDLEKSIKAWRRSWAKYALEDERSEELERHLRDAYEAHQRSGGPEHEAWQKAVAELGPALEVSHEIKKVDGRSRAEMCVVKCAFTAVAIYYCWAMISAACVPFGNQAMPFAQAVRHVSEASAEKSLEAIASVPGLLLGLMLLCVGRYLKSTQKRIRLGICTAGLSIPIMIYAIMAGFAGGIQLWGLSAITAPWATYEIAFGSVDGEFYADGNVWVSAVGWWIILWGILLAMESCRSSFSLWHSKLLKYQVTIIGPQCLN